MPSSFFFDCSYCIGDGKSDSSGRSTAYPLSFSQPQWKPSGHTGEELRATRFPHQASLMPYDIEVRFGGWQIPARATGTDFRVRKRPDGFIEGGARLSGSLCDWNYESNSFRQKFDFRDGGSRSGFPAPASLFSCDRQPVALNDIQATY